MDYKKMTLEERAEYLGISPKIWGEYEGKSWSMWVKLNGEESAMYLVHHMDGNWIKYLSFYTKIHTTFDGLRSGTMKFAKNDKKSFYDLMLIYENEPYENRMYGFESYADYFGHKAILADPNHWGFSG